MPSWHYICLLMTVERFVYCWLKILKFNHSSRRWWRGRSGRRKSAAAKNISIGKREHFLRFEIYFRNFSLTCVLSIFWLNFWWRSETPDLFQDGWTIGWKKIPSIQMVILFKFVLIVKTVFEFFLFCFYTEISLQVHFFNLIKQVL